MISKPLKILAIFMAILLITPSSFSADEKKPSKENSASGPSSSSNSGGGSGSSNGNSKVQQPIPAPTTTSQPVEVVNNSRANSTPEPVATNSSPAPVASASPTTDEQVSSAPTSSAQGGSTQPSQGNSGGSNANSNQGNGKSDENSDQPGSSSNNPNQKDQVTPQSSSPTTAPSPSPVAAPGKSDEAKQESAKPNPSPQASPSSTPASDSAPEKKSDTKENSKPESSNGPSNSSASQNVERSASSSGETPNKISPSKPKDVGTVSISNSNTGVNPSASKKSIVNPSSFKNPKLIAGSVAPELLNASAKQLEKLSADQSCGVSSKSANVAQASTKSATSTSTKKTNTKSTNKSGATSNASQQGSDSSADGEAIEECKDFILVFTKDSTKSDIDSAAQSAKGKVLRNFNNVFKGALVNGPPSKILALAKNPKVQAIEMDGAVSTQDIYQNPVWGLDRVDQRLLPLNSSYDDLNNSGFSIPIYIVDSGIYAEHSEFSGRIAPGVTTITDGYGTWDCNGHGTHVAGITAGSSFGVAKTATLIPVRVLGCNGSGTYSGVIAGLDWIAANHPAGVPAVVNMSLSGPASSSLDTAVNNLITRGITVVAAAGNAAADACNYSPARVPAAITVAATSADDSRASYSNFGSCIDVFAPGSSITSAWNNGVNGSAVASGTSMASPHVAGAIARFLYLNPTASPAQVADSLNQAATLDVILDPGLGSINRLLFIDFAPAPAPEPTPTTKPTRSKKSTNPGKGNKP